MLNYYHYHSHSLGCTPSAHKDNQHSKQTKVCFPKRAEGRRFYAGGYQSLGMQRLVFHQRIVTSGTVQYPRRNLIQIKPLSWPLHEPEHDVRYNKNSLSASSSCHKNKTCLLRRVCCLTNSVDNMLQMVVNRGKRESGLQVQVSKHTQVLLNVNRWYNTASLGCTKMPARVNLMAIKSILIERWPYPGRSHASSWHVF